MRVRPVVIALLVAPLLAALPAPAGADKPTEVEYTVTFEDWNPCTGALIDVTINAVAYDHFHNNTFVSPGKWISGSTSDGYRLEKAHDHYLDNGNHFMIQIKAFFENEEEGLRFRTAFYLKQTYDGDVLETKSLRGNMKCFGAPTILPPE